MLRAIDGAYDEMRGDSVADVHWEQKANRLRAIDRAGTGEEHADHGREDRRGQHAVNDARTELRLRRKGFVDVQRVHVTGDVDEPLHVGFGERLGEGDVLSD